MRWSHTCIAALLQVHRAVMTIEGVRRVVAVKVRHPGVADIIRRDFQVFIKDLTLHQYNTTRMLNPACSCMAVTNNCGFLTAAHCI